MRLHIVKNCCLLDAVHLADDVLQLHLQCQLRHFLLLGLRNHEIARIDHVFHGIAKIARQGARFGQRGHVCRLFATRNPNAVAIEFGIVQANFAERRLHRGNFACRNGFAAEQIRITAGELVIEQIRDTHHDHHQQHSRGNAGGWRHRAKQIAELSNGFIDKIHWRASLQEWRDLTLNYESFSEPALI